MDKTKNIETRLVQAGLDDDPGHHAVAPPLYLTSTYQIADLETRGRHEYSRTSNPTRQHLADALSDLEGGFGACVTASGMAALTIILHLLEPGDLLLAPYDCYGRSYRLMSELAKKGHFRVRFVDPYSPQGLQDAFLETPRMVLLETPSNPLMRIADIAATVKLAKACGALVVADNTFLSPVRQRPLEMGADIVFHSTTKFLNGHSDVVGGCVVARTKDLHEALHGWNNMLGTIGAPFDSYMTLRGLRTLELRMKRGEDSAMAIAYMLQQDARVSAVHYPGLPAHPGHGIAKSQQSGFGAMLSFQLKGSLAQTKSFLSGLEIFRLAQSLGGTESLINHPASMTHVSMGPEARAQAGVTDNLLRLSVGIEDTGDLVRDLQNALARL